MTIPSRITLPLRSTIVAAILGFALSLHPAVAVDAVVLAPIHSPADLDALIASTTNATLKQALRDHAAAILSAAEQHPHVEAVIRAVESSPGKVEKINTTPEALKKAAGGDIALFDTLKLVDLAMPNAGPHDHRKTDPVPVAKKRKGGRAFDWGNARPPS